MISTMKSLTEEYFLLRTNSIQRRRFQNDSKVSLVLGINLLAKFILFFQSQFTPYEDDEAHVRLLRDMEDGEDSLHFRANGDASSNIGPPSFVGQSEALQYQMDRAENKVTQLDALHTRHLARPTLDDEPQEEAEIQSLTKEITNVSIRMISAMARLLNSILSYRCSQNAIIRSKRYEETR